MGRFCLAFALLNIQINICLVLSGQPCERFWPSQNCATLLNDAIIGVPVSMRTISGWMCQAILWPQPPQDPPAGLTGNADNVPFIGATDPQGNPVRLAKRSGHVSNYDEAQVPEFDLPELLTLSDGQPVRNAEDWNRRRGEILEFYRTEIYGAVPDTVPGVNWQVVETNADSHPSASTSKIIRARASSGGKTREFQMTLCLPRGQAGPVPVLLHLSFFGNLRVPQPGTQAAAVDPARAVLEHGWAYALIGYNEIQPDRPDQFDQGVIGLTLPAEASRPRANQWGTISAWAWGASRAVDYLARDPAIDPQRISLTGASRLGKTSLWAAAQDQRIASVLAIVPGEMGASLIRRDWGETLDDMAQNFHWQFAGNLQKWVGRWDELPVDQHMLIALLAPRPVYVNGGLKDQWSDPKGEFLAMVAAGPAYELLGVPGLGTRTLPALDHPLVSGRLAFHYHSQGHQSVPEDWEQYLRFASKNFASLEEDDFLLRP